MSIPGSDSEISAESIAADNMGAAGPSTPRRHPSSPSRIPEVEAIDPDEIASVQKHLDRRRKASLVPVPGSSKTRAAKAKARARLRSGSDVSAGSHGSVGSPGLAAERDPAWFEQMNDVDEDVEDGGLAAGSEGVERSLTFDLEELRRRMPEAVKLFQDGQDYKGVNLEQGLKQGYAWDVMFENQRGIHFLGKAYFSSNSLLPSDPSQYTLPSYPLPSATTLVVAETDGAERTERRIKTSRPWMKRPHASSSRPKDSKDPKGDAYGGDKAHKINLSSAKRDIKTAYSLATFQCPGPQWTWVTPWMINMKVGTDEGGWRYNAWFRSGGWKNHAGPAGWAGWVRRREWVRLRMVSGIEREEGEGNGPSGLEKEGENGSHGASTPQSNKKELLDILQGTAEGGLGPEILHHTTAIPLDREKLAWWEAGLGRIDNMQDKGALNQLRGIFADGDSVAMLHHAFTYCSTYAAFVSLLEKYGIEVVHRASPAQQTSPSGSKAEQAVV